MRISRETRPTSPPTVHPNGVSPNGVAHPLGVAAAVAPVSRGLLDNRHLLAFARSRLWPAILAYPTLVVFGYILVALLVGPGAASANLGTGLTWVLWWPLIPLAMFATGRLWCAICPFGTLIDLVQRVAGLGRPVPPFLKKYGIWIIDATFLGITWADHAFGIVESPRGSGYLLGLLVTASVVSAVVFERRAWCRYLCFLGGLSGNYSRASGLQLRATPEICRSCTVQYCYKGNGNVAGCPIFEVPRAMTSMANCNLCANCIKSCPNGSIRLLWRKPTSELWFIAKPKLSEAFLAVAIVGIVLVQNITMLSFWEPLMATLGGWLFGSRVAAFTAVFLVAMALPFGLVLAAARYSHGERRERLFENFARFGYAVIPLDLAGHLAHNLFHLLAESGTLVYNAIGLVGVYTTGPAGVLPTPTIQALQFGLLALGIGGSLFTAWKIAGRTPSGFGPARGLIPHIVVLALFGAVNVYLFTLPMAHRV
ncbi:MAG: 4Fe-4S binding protein [Chloroflexota bacterium]|nr:MAG: 4Fe-4S binding protein [Chloroflexota bacterium]